MFKKQSTITLPQATDKCLDFKNPLSIFVPSNKYISRRKQKIQEKIHLLKFDANIYSILWISNSFSRINSSSFSSILQWKDKKFSFLFTSTWLSPSSTWLRHFLLSSKSFFLAREWWLKYLQKIWRT